MNMNPFSEINANMSDIWNNRLFLGSQYSSRSLEIDRNNITHVISIGCRPIHQFPHITNHIYHTEDNGEQNNVTTFFNEYIPEIHQYMNTILTNPNNKILSIYDNR